MIDYATTAMDILRNGDNAVSSDTLVEILTEASDQYYNGEGESFLSDDEYDQLERMLKRIDPKNTYLLEVGAAVRGGKVPLPDPMGSLDQVYEGDTARWIAQNGWQNEDFVLSDKLDGISGSTYYDARGTLKVGYSRGKATEGADVTRHVKNIRGVPARINGALAVRAEIIIPVKDFPALRNTLVARSGRLYKNPRNTVAGRMNASESPQEFYDAVRMVVTSTFDNSVSRIEQLERCRREGFEVVHYVVVKGKDLNDEFLTQYLNQRRKDSLYELDGIVIDLDNAEIRKRLAAKQARENPTDFNPPFARKFKVAGEDNLAETTVTQVLWRVSKAGYLKPRVEINPVDLVGVTITYATGFNAKFIKDQGIGPGARIQITRAGDVIPYIQKVLAPSPTGAQLPSDEEFGDMKWTDGDVDLVLTDPSGNAEGNLMLLIDIFKNWEVPFLRQGSVEKLIEAGFDTAEKIILASEADIKRAVGDSAGTKIYEGIRSRLNPIELPLLVGGSQTIGRGMGVRKMTKLCEALNITGIDQLDGLTVERISAVDGFERKTAEVIVRNMPRFLTFAGAIAGHYTVAAPKAKVVGGALAEVVAVFTGVRDKELEGKIADGGGTIGSSVNAKTTHLVCKDPSSNSSKMQKARDLGCKVISLEEAQALWG
jgi:NAD-dependent DNA ligase